MLCKVSADTFPLLQDIELPPEHPGQEVLKWTHRAVKIDSQEYLAAKQDMLLVAGTKGLDDVFEKYGLDAVFSLAEGGQQSAANMVGYPTGRWAGLTWNRGGAQRLIGDNFVGAVPLGVSKDGVPFGAMFIGRKFGERALLEIM